MQHLSLCSDCAHSSVPFDGTDSGYLKQSHKKQSEHLSILHRNHYSSNIFVQLLQDGAKLSLANRHIILFEALYEYDY